LNLDKPSGWTSRAVVDRVSRPLRGVKVGHAGTLDPLASGVLVVCVGAATRLIELVQRMPKTYRTVVRLGARSDTLDADGEVTETPSPRVASEADVRRALDGQVGTILQQPPEFSALKVAGKRAYDLARAGESVALQPRPVRIDRIALLAYEWPRLTLEIDCGSGTYIRSIARDIGEALGCGGLVEVLVRTRIGPFTKDEALDPLELSVESIPTRLRPALEAAAGLPRVFLSAEQVADAAQGRLIRLESLAEDVLLAHEVALMDAQGTLVAIAEPDAGARCLHPRRVLIGRPEGVHGQSHVNR
jgi:tRNA pseudouridine55 synthase